MFPNIDAERARLGLSRVALAEKLGVSYGTVKNWMKGTTDIPASKVAEMSRLFHCSTDYLLGVGTAQDSA
jgi:transcriptional regulator with XRE-family HTH domain